MGFCDWEMRARQLAEDLRVVGVALLGACAWLWFEVDGWMSWLAVIGMGGAVNAIAGARIES